MSIRSPRPLPTTMRALEVCAYDGAPESLALVDRPARPHAHRTAGGL
ncbi:MAG: hypothetical protein WCF99_14705 [Chloroflexales bacterium]